ncbi:MAG: LytTR family DNA-binding domain-containing protein [Chitinophagales bacterium]|nr:LytTR family DNA-binding domain-containing protein [Chitinophagales bacterium]
MRCIIVDDDELSIKLIQQFVEQTDFLELFTSFTDPVEASNLLMKEDIDLLFLDVEMPNLSGLELIKNLEQKPQIILITSKKDYALEAFEYQVTDYLLKPPTFPRFLKAVQKAKEIHDERVKVPIQHVESLYVKEDNIWVNVPFDHILWVEALGDYVTINLGSKKHTVLTTMKAIEKRLPIDKFARVHRSFIVPVNKIQNLDGNMLVIEKKFIPIGKSYRKSLMDRLNIL